jgi:hypothetical protein
MEYGFVALPEKFQTKPESVAMIRYSKETMDALLVDADFRPPRYF